MRCCTSVQKLIMSKYDRCYYKDEYLHGYQYLDIQFSHTHNWEKIERKNNKIIFIFKIIK
jgi:hypothetical protein